MSYVTRKKIDEILIVYSNISFSDFHYLELRYLLNEDIKTKVFSVRVLFLNIVLMYGKAAEEIGALSQAQIYMRLSEQ